MTKKIDKAKMQNVKKRLVFNSFSSEEKQDFFDLEDLDNSDNF